jgi:putative ABC transport system permease protein
VKKLYHGYDHLVHLDLPLMATAIAIAVGAAIVAGLYPTWRVCQVAPANYLKTQ